MRQWRAFLAGTALPLFLLACAGGVFLLGWVVVWALSYRLTHGNQYTYTLLTTYDTLWQWLYECLLIFHAIDPRIEPPESLEAVLVALLFGFAFLSIGYLSGIVLLHRGLALAPGAVWLVLGVGVGSQVPLFLLPGAFSTDPFSYVIYGHIAGLYGFNPYIYPPLSFPDHPILPWINEVWHTAPSVYGPLWTNIGWAMARWFEHWDLTHQVLAYKALMNLAHLANLALVWWLLRYLVQGPSARARRTRVTALAVFAWNPVLLFETAGNAHNDGLMVTFLLLSLVPLVVWLHKRCAAETGSAPGQHARAARDAATYRHGPMQATPGSIMWGLAILYVTFSVLVKYMSGIVGLFYAVAWARLLPTWRARFVALASAGAVSLAVTLLLFWPWLDRPDALQPILGAAGRDLYMNSLQDYLVISLADLVADRTGREPYFVYLEARSWARLVVRTLFFIYLGWEVLRLWRLTAQRSQLVLQHVLAASVRVMLVLLLVVLTWVWPWYFTWPLALAALLTWQSRLTQITVGYSLASLPIMYGHHYLGWYFPQVLLVPFTLVPLLAPWLFSLVRRGDTRLLSPPASLPRHAPITSPNGHPERSEGAGVAPRLPERESV